MELSASKEGAHGVEPGCVAKVKLFKKYDLLLKSKLISVKSNH